MKGYQEAKLPQR